MGAGGDSGGRRQLGVCEGTLRSRLKLPRSRLSKGDVEAVNATSCFCPQPRHLRLAYCPSLLASPPITGRHGRVTGSRVGDAEAAGAPVHDTTSAWLTAHPCFPTPPPSQADLAKSQTAEREMRKQLLPPSAGQDPQPLFTAPPQLCFLPPPPCLPSLPTPPIESQADLAKSQAAEREMRKQVDEQRVVAATAARAVAVAEAEVAALEAASEAAVAQVRGGEGEGVQGGVMAGDGREGPRLRWQRISSGSGAGALCRELVVTVGVGGSL